MQPGKYYKKGSDIMFFDDHIIREVLEPVTRSNISDIFKTIDGNKDICKDIHNSILPVIKDVKL